MDIELKTLTEPLLHSPANPNAPNAPTTAAQPNDGPVIVATSSGNMRTLHLSGMTSGTNPSLANKLNNQKYTIFNFVPKVLYEQFKFFFNMFFLLLCLSQFIPMFKVGLLFSYVSPLVFVLTLTMIKEGYDDYKRYVRDKETNNRPYMVWDGREFVSKPSADLKEGNIIEIHAGERLPADCLLLWTSDPSHSVFIKTDQLDGETDWKLRNPVTALQRSLTAIGPKGLTSMSGYLRSEGPSDRMYDYKGTWVGEAGAGNQPLGLENMLWASTVLCSAHAIIMVVFIGAETRIRMNIKEGKLKIGRLDQELNEMTKYLFGMMIVISILLEWAAGSNGSFIVEVVKYVLLLSSIIPISLRINLDFSKIVFSYKINSDPDIKAVVRNSQIPEELGRVGYIFSDKTGTLTQNVMQFKKIATEFLKFSHEDEQYIKQQIKKNMPGVMKEIESQDHQTGSAPKKQPTLISSNETLRPVPFDPNVNLLDSQIPTDQNPLQSDATNKFVKRNRKLILPKNQSITQNQTGTGTKNAGYSTVRRTLVDKNDARPILVIREILLALNVCHNVTPVEEEGLRVLQASSPDEIALVEAAEKFGLILRNRTQTTMDLFWEDFQVSQSFQILNNFPFTSKKKRMGIIVKDNLTGRFIFYLKGADEIMRNRVHQNQRGFLKDNCDDLSREGLRTLVYAYKILSEEEYRMWAEDFHAASTEIERREELQEAVTERLENNMEILMITGVEDKLQEECALTISDIRRAGIKFWMLTGDKIETVSCVAISAGLKRPEQEFCVLREITSSDDLDRELKKFHLMNEKGVLVVDSISLDTAMKFNEEFFFKEAGKAESVVCCRLSPKQKSKVVKAIKKYCSEVTLSVGDGGNDVAMIKKAHIGVGIVGKEGKQAALASDFSIDRFKDLKHLVLWHGRNSYKRGAVMAQFVIHRGLIISIMQVYFLIVYNFIQVPLFNGYLMLGYTTVYTMLPVFSLIFDEDINKQKAFQFSNLYQELQKGAELTKKTMLIWVWRSIYQGFIIILMNVALYGNMYVDFVGISFTSLIFVQLLNIVSEVNHWNRIVLGSVISSVVLYVVSVIFLKDYFGLSEFTLVYYIKALVTALVCYIPIILGKRIMIWLQPPDERKIMKQVRLQRKGKLRMILDKFILCRKEDISARDYL
jgi:phospholipid-translocating ATPase